MSMASTLAFISKHQVKFIDLRFTDTLGKEQHISIPSHQANATFFTEGKGFDGSSVVGWKSIDDSDMILRPDPSSAVLDPFCHDATLILRCDVIDPTTEKGYLRDPRSLAKRAEAYLESTGFADQVLFGPEPEFFILDDVKFKSSMSGCMYQINSEEAFWNSDTSYSQGNLGHRPQVKEGYSPVPPVDASQNLRSQISLLLEQVGIQVEAHHHEVATAGQNEIATGCAGLLRKADEVQLLKYVVRNAAHQAGKTATFMPKPLVGDNGSGMHCHQSLIQQGRNLFAGDAYAGLSETALFYIGGLIKHAQALNAFTNPSTNSYKRLIQGFEAPVILAYSQRNRSAAIRVPAMHRQEQARIEARFPDCTANPYLAFSAMLMAGLDGIAHQIHPGEAMDKNLYQLSKQEMTELPQVANRLEQALEALDQDRDFLLAGQVFSNDLIDAYIELKHQDIMKLHQATHPVEFEMYYSL